MKAITKFYGITSVNLLRNIYFVLIALLIVAMTPDVTNFSGDWTLNNEKSNFGNSEFKNAATKLKITQEATKLISNDMEPEEMEKPIPIQKRLHWMEKNVRTPLTREEKENQLLPGQPIARGLPLIHQIQWSAMDKLLK